MEERIESEGKRVIKTQGKCLLMQAQGRTPLAPVSALWVVGYFAYLLNAKMCVCVLKLSTLYVPFFHSQTFF